MVFHWSLGDSKSPWVSRTLLSILADLNNAVVWMVSTRLLISSPPLPVPILWLLYWAHHLQLLSLGLAVWPRLDDPFVSVIIFILLLWEFLLWINFYQSLQFSRPLHNILVSNAVCCGLDDFNPSTDLLNLVIFFLFPSFLEVFRGFLLLLVSLTPLCSVTFFYPFSIFIIIIITMLLLPILIFKILKFSFQL